MSTDVQTILQLAVPVIVQVAERQMPVDSVLALAPGAILELNKSAEAPLDLLVNNKPIGEGHAVKVGENFGIQINSIHSRQALVQALGGN